MKAYKLFLAILITLSLTANYVYADESSEVINHINNYYYGTFSENTNMSFKRDRYTSENLYLQNLVSSLDEYSQYYTKEELENSNLSYDKSIETTMYGKDIFNIKINDFREGTDKEFSEYLDKYLRIGAKTMILDLSDCQGGRMDIMANIAKKIVPKGLICTMIFKNSKFDYYSTLENEPCKMIVLVSQKTASAAEALVSALKCTHAATIAGEITYGKSAIQQIFTISNGGVLKLTVGKFITRDGQDIAGIGIIPDSLMDAPDIRTMQISNRNIKYYVK